MVQRARVTGALVGMLVLMGFPAMAFEGNAARGKVIFMTKGQGDKACMTCHPRGLTTGKTFKGKDIPELTEPISERKLVRKTRRFLKLQGMQLSEAEVTDLLTFVQRLPTQGFGPVPPDWKGYVDKALGE